MSTKILIYLLRHDLRLFDNLVFQEISRTYDALGSSLTHLLPIYVFRADQIETSGFVFNCEDLASAPETRYAEARIED
jgi:deoxyribodipyrimidine photo-lyase